MKQFRIHLLLTFLTLTFLVTPVLHAQAVVDDRVVASPDDVRYYTWLWEGERLPDGRPYVADKWLERLKNVKVEDAWQLLNELGYTKQYEGGWTILHEDQPMTGRALTAVYMPNRPDVQGRLFEEGLAAGHIGSMNSWPIDLLQDGDIYIADSFGKIAQGTMIGDKLGNSIYTRSQNGVVFDGSIRDVEGLEQIDGFNAFTREWHPSFLEDVMLTGINVPVRIGEITVLPGDVILAKKIGLVVIPSHLVTEVVITSEIVALRDEFSHERVQEGIYTAGQVDAQWSEAMEEDFLEWVQDADHIDRMPVSLEEMQEFMQHRTW